MSHALPMLGKQPYRHRDDAVFFDDHIEDPSALPTPPDEFDYDEETPNDALLMYHNDAEGDCTCVGLAVLVQLATQSAGKILIPPNDWAQDLYKLTGGYDPSRAGPDGSNPTDNGENEQELLAWCKANQEFQGIPLDIAGSVQMNLRNPTRVQQGAWIFNGVYIGIALPIAFQDMGVQWNMNGYNPSDPAWQSGGWGGHCVYVTGHSAKRGGYLFRSWAQRGFMTDEVFHTFVDEVHGVPSKDMLGPKEISPRGLNWDSLEQALSQFGQEQ